MSFVASLAGSLAWPSAVLVIALVFRSSFRRILERVTRVKWGEAELEIDRQVAQARADLVAGRGRLELPSPSPESARPLEYFQTLSQLSPRAAMLEAWWPFEVAASEIAAALSITKPGGRPLQMAELFTGLVKEGVLTSEEEQALNRLRAVRNAVVHAPSEDLSPASAVEYAGILQDITQAMRARFAVR